MALGLKKHKKLDMTQCLETLIGQYLSCSSNSSLRKNSKTEEYLLIILKKVHPELYLKLTIWEYNPIRDLVTLS
jgi:hypothetical protein